VSPDASVEGSGLLHEANATAVATKLAARIRMFLTPLPSRRGACLVHMTNVELTGARRCTDGSGIPPKAPHRVYVRPGVAETAARGGRRGLKQS
jgi:hypothetical protein